MIVSHEHRFIFLKTRKTAGTSIEIALSQHAGPDDVITRIGREGEALRVADGGRGAQNDQLPATRYRARELAKALRTRRPVRAYNHMPAAEVRAWVSPEVWRDYRKFTVVRNPFDATISFYHWRLRDVPASSRPSLSEFVRGDGLDELTWNWSIYTIDDRVVADHVCRYESLATDVAAVATTLGLPDLELPRIKSGTRKDSRSPRDLFDEDDVRVIRRRFARELETFGYDLS